MYSVYKFTVCPHPARQCCWDVAMGMETVEKVGQGWAEAAQCWCQWKQRWRARLVRQRMRRWADSESIALLVHPPRIHPMDKPADKPRSLQMHACCYLPKNKHAWPYCKYGNCPHGPAPTLVRGACSLLARLLVWRPESHRGEAELTAASDAGWQILVERNEQNCNVHKHAQINTLWL